jgi:hypothetical protein
VGLTRKRTLSLVAFVALAVLSLRPVPGVERAVGWALVPARVLAELGLPVSWLRAGEVRAAEKELSAGLAEGRARCAEIVRLDRASARPQTAELCAGRTLMQAEVVGRPVGRRDQVVLELAEEAELREGLPVVRGDHYVGRVESVPDVPLGAPRRAIVSLVTGSSFRIGARVVAEGADDVGLVVGGLAPRVPGRNTLLLAAHKPSNQRVASGRVVVHDRDALIEEDLARLADGYALGELEEARIGGSRVVVVRPGPDYRDGLTQLVVLGPVDGGGSGERTREIALDHDPFDERAWLWADVAFPGGPSFWREGRKLGIGRARGVREGAAVIFGARLVGRVLRAHVASADVALLGDRGLVLSGLARVEGRAEPLPLGRLTVLGRTEEGTIRLGWDALVPFEGPLPARAEVFTGSGLAGLPRGLYVGSVVLPVGPGPHVLELADVPALGDLGRVQVRRARPVHGGGA